MDTLLVLVGQYNQKMGHTTGKGEGILVYIMNENTGQLSLIKTITRYLAGINPSFFTIDSKNNMLYVCNEYVKCLSTLKSFGEDPCYICMSNDIENNKFINVACYGVDRKSAVSVYQIKAQDRTLKPLQSSIALNINQGSNIVKDRQKLSHFHCVLPCKTITDDKLEFYASDLGTDRISHYVLGNNELLLKSSIDSFPGSGPRHLYFHPRIKGVLYWNTELSNEVYVVQFDTANNKLKRIVQRLSTIPVNISQTSAADIIGTSHIMCDHSWQYLYCANRGINCIVRFIIDQETGWLLNRNTTDIQFYSCHGHIPRHFNISPNNSFLLVANQEKDEKHSRNCNISVFKIVENGELQFLLSVENQNPACIQFLKCKPRVHSNL